MKTGKLDALADKALRELQQSPYFRGRTNTLKLQSRAGRVTASGRLPSFYLKQVLQEFLRRVEGVQSVTNNVHVVSADSLSSPGDDPTHDEPAGDEPALHRTLEVEHDKE